MIFGTGGTGGTTGTPVPSVPNCSTTVFATVQPSDNINHPNRIKDSKPCFKFH